MMAGPEGDKDFGVHVSDIVGRHEREVVGRWHALQIVDGIDLVGVNNLADSSLDLCQHALGILKSGAYRSAEVKLHEPNIDGGKEVRADHKGQNRGDREEQTENAESEDAMMQHQVQDTAIARLQSLESVFALAV